MRIRRGTILHILLRLLIQAFYPKLRQAVVLERMQISVRVNCFVEKNIGSITPWLDMTNNQSVKLPLWLLFSWRFSGRSVHEKLSFRFKWSQLVAHYLLVYLFQLLYMFRATMYPSSGEFTVSMRHWYFSIWSAGWDETLHVLLYQTDHTATHTEWKIPVSHRYSKFCWWWKHDCPKHVEKLN